MIISLFIVYNPFNKEEKILNPLLFNKCFPFTLSCMEEINVINAI